MYKRFLIKDLSNGLYYSSTGWVKNGVIATYFTSEEEAKVRAFSSYGGRYEIISFYSKDVD